MKLFSLFLAILLVAGFALTASAANAQYYNEPYCREFQQDFRIGNHIQHGYGTACQQPDGAWQVQQGSNVPRGVRYIQEPRYVEAERYPTYYPPYQPVPRYYRAPSYYYPAPVSLSFAFGNYSRGRGHHWRHH